MNLTLDRSNFRIFTHLDLNIYDQYRKLKGQVFCIEQSWPIQLDMDGLTEPDVFDKYAHFFGGFDSDSKLLGAVRGISLDRHFPYRDYFSKDLTDAELCQACESGFTLNALLCQSTYRGIKNVSLADSQGNPTQPLTIGQALTTLICQYFHQFAKTTCYITAMSKTSEKFFLCNGFTPLGKVFTPDNLSIPLINMKKK
ncbi:MAG: hypothetical protein QNK36_04920 [Colwellia sp.]|nr:hypothetical protein [Colwellia sp.]